MALHRKPNMPTPDADAFIAGAPDAAPKAKAAEVKPDEVKPYEKGIAKGNKRQISLTIPPEMLRKIDEIAARTGQARAAIINMAIYQAVEGDMFK